ncbi:MAG TPA: acyl carrier protein [Terriglobales bacterium]|nr:acyl carrier protein [Terriglobales bacterium]
MISESPLFPELQDLFVEIFHVQRVDVGPETQFGELPQWDSMGHMDLMLALEEKYGVEISAETIGQLISIPAIITYIETKQNA